MNFIFNFILGIFIGAGAILPGISSGVICVVFGIYEKLINSVLYFFKNIKNNIKFLTPICLGGIIGVLIFSKLISYCLNKIPCQTKSLFIGLLLGSLYLLIKSNMTIKKEEKKSCYISLIICFLIGIFLIYIEKIFNTYITYNINSTNFLYLILSGFFMSIGIVVPGVSSTVILNLLGIYSTYLNSINTLNINILAPMFIGLYIGSLVFMKIIKILLGNFHNQTMFGIIGFSLGSILILFPNYGFNFESFIGIFIMILSFAISKNIKN